MLKNAFRFVACSFAVAALCAHGERGSAATFEQQRLAAMGARDLGSADARRPIELTVTLARRHERELAQLVTLQATPGSPMRYRFLTPAQFDAYFGPAPATVTEVIRALAAGGFRREAVRTPASVARFVGTIGSAERLFSTEIHAVVQRGRLTYARVRPSRVPAFIARDIVAVSGLDGVDPSGAGLSMPMNPLATDEVLPDLVARRPRPGPTPPPLCKPAASPSTVDVDEAQSAQNGTNGYSPATFEADFDFPIEYGCGGFGETIGVVASNVPNASDISAYYSHFSISPTPAPYTVRSTSTSTSSESILEVTLDIDTVSSLAPQSNVTLYEIPDYSYTSVINALNDAATDNSVDVLNLSLADCESGSASDVSAEDSAIEELVSLGITVVVASGDTGYESCFGTAGTIGAPASSAYAVTVGGVGPAGSNAYRQVTGWSGSGGGVSSVIARPSYQSQISACSGAFRCIPDIAMASGFGTYPVISSANDGIFAYLAGSTYVLVGTSLAAPMFAAMQAEADQYIGHRAGFINPLLYADAYPRGGGRARRPGGLVRDVTTGNNGEPALPGWDFVTGLGVPDGTALATFER